MTITVKKSSIIMKRKQPRLQVNSLNEYEEIMNNLKLDRPELMDYNVPANVKGITLKN